MAFIHSPRPLTTTLASPAMAAMPESVATTVALAGLGAIGLPVARALDQGRIPGLRLSAVAVRARFRIFATRLKSSPSIVSAPSPIA